MAADEEFVPKNAAEQSNAVDDEFVPENVAEQSNAAEDEFGPEYAAEQSNTTEHTNAVEENDAAVESEGEEEEAGAEKSGTEEEAFQEEVPEKRVNPNMGVEDPNENAMWFKEWIYEALPEVGMEIDAESREDADVLAAAREASSQEKVKKVAVEKRNRELDVISEEVTKKVKAEIQSPEFIQMLANAIVSLLPGIVTTGAGEREQKAGEKDRGLFLETSVGAGDNQAGLMIEHPLCSQLPNTQETAAEFAWNYDIHHNVFGGESPYSTQETQSSIPTTVDKIIHTAEDEIQPRPVRKKFPAAVLKSPFRIRENRGIDFNKYMQNKDGEKRNVGLPFAIGKDYFEYIKDVKKELEHMHMEPYVAMLAKAPHIAKVHGVQNRFVAMGVQFQKAVEDVWKAMHGDKPEGWVPDHNTEEVIPAEHMEHLEQFAEGLLPEWGGLKKWIEADKLVLLCYFDIAKHWTLHQRDSVSCGLLALKSMENRLTDTVDKMMYKKNLPEWRAHIAETIYNYSTHESMIAH
ncbi:hypothetical protein OROMI_000910 [Orobanche minor]